jgi:hypothetical protein
MAHKRCREYLGCFRISIAETLFQAEFFKIAIDMQGSLASEVVY